MITRFAPGTSRELDPRKRERRREPEPQHTVRQLHRDVAPEQHAGDRAHEQPTHRVQVDVPGDEMAGPRDPEQRGRVEDVRAHDLRRREREDEQHHEAEEGAAPRRR